MLGLKAAWEEKAFMENFGCSMPVLLRNMGVFRAFAVKINLCTEERISPKPLLPAVKGFGNAITLDVGTLYCSECCLCRQVTTDERFLMSKCVDK